MGSLYRRTDIALKLPVEEKISPLFFDFDYRKNSSRQYLWLGAGGPLGNIVLITGLLVWLPINTPAQQWLLATVCGQLVYVLVLEAPVSFGIIAGKNPLEVLSKHFGQGKPLFQRSMLMGIANGVLLLLCLKFF